MHVVRFGLYLRIANPKAKNKDVLKEKGKHVWAYQCQPQTQSPTLFRPTTKPWNINDTQCRCRCSCAKIFPKLNLKLFPPLIFVWLITLHSVFPQIQMSYQCTDCGDWQSCQYWNRGNRVHFTSTFYFLFQERSLLNIYKTIYKTRRVKFVNIIPTNISFYNSTLSQTL